MFKFNENYLQRDARNSINPKLSKKEEKDNIKAHHNQIVQDEWYKENLKRNRKQNHVRCRGTKIEMTVNFLQRQGKQEDRVQDLWCAIGQKMVNLFPICSDNNFQKWNKIKTFSDIQPLRNLSLVSSYDNKCLKKGKSPSGKRKMIPIWAIWISTNNEEHQKWSLEYIKVFKIFLLIFKFL